MVHSWRLHPSAHRGPDPRVNRSDRHCFRPQPTGAIPTDVEFARNRSGCRPTRCRWRMLPANAWERGSCLGDKLDDAIEVLEDVMVSEPQKIPTEPLWRDPSWVRTWSGARPARPARPVLGSYLLG